MKEERDEEEGDGIPLGRSVPSSPPVNTPTNSNWFELWLESMISDFGRNPPVHGPCY